MAKIRALLCLLSSRWRSVPWTKIWAGCNQESHHHRCCVDNKDKTPSAGKHLSSSNPLRTFVIALCQTYFFAYYCSNVYCHPLLSELGGSQAYPVSSLTDHAGYQTMSQQRFRLEIIIQSCRGLLIADRKSSDPYVKIKLGAGSSSGSGGGKQEDLHETKHLLQTLDPVYTTKHNNTYMLDIDKKKLSIANGLTFKIKDWDRIGTNDDIGHVDVSYDELVTIRNSTRSRSSSGPVVKEFKIIPPKKRSKEDAGYITIGFVTTDAVILAGRSDNDGATTTADEKKDQASSETTAASAAVAATTAQQPPPAAAVTPPRIMRLFGGGGDKGDSAKKKKPPLSPTRATVPRPATASMDEVSVSDSISVDLAADGASMEVVDTTITSEASAIPSNVTHVVIDELVIEIVSCTNLLIGDVMTKSSDPYVKVKIANEEKVDIHETKYIVQTLNPTYTIDTDSTFYIGKSDLKNDFDTYGLELKVKDYDQFGTNDELGFVLVPAQDIYSHIDKTMELKLTPPKGKKRTKDAGYITIHCRHYNPKDPNDKELKNKFLSKVNGSGKPATISSILGLGEGGGGAPPQVDSPTSGLPPPAPSGFKHKNANHQDMSLKSMRLWDAKLPPVKKHMVQGYLVPTVQGNLGMMNKLVSKRRRVTLEVYQSKADAATAAAEADDNNGEEHKSEMFHSLLKGISVGNLEEDQQFDLADSDEVILRILKAKRKGKADAGDSSDHDGT